jgi:hypothetical protein
VEIVPYGAGNDPYYWLKMGVKEGLLGLKTLILLPKSF